MSRSTDVSMTYRADTGKTPTTTAAMSITNSGQTFSRVRGELTVERQDGASGALLRTWLSRSAASSPGVTLKLGGDLKRRLPSGTYRLRAEPVRRRSPRRALEKIVQFTGDPTATVAYDATLVLQPGTVDMKVVPGATRTTDSQHREHQRRSVRIAMDSRTPRGLLGVQMGDLVGAALSASPGRRSNRHRLRCAATAGRTSASSAPCRRQA